MTLRDDVHELDDVLIGCNDDGDLCISDENSEIRIPRKHLKVLSQLLAEEQGSLHKAYSCMTCPFRGQSVLSLAVLLLGGKSTSGVCNHPSRITTSQTGSFVPAPVLDVRVMPVECPLRSKSLMIVSDIPQG